MTTRFRANGPQVISETIQGEVIIIHLDTGTYYSLRDAGAAIWDSIEHGAGIDEIVEGLAARYDAPREDLERAAAALLDELQAEALISPAESGSNGAAPVAAASDGAAARAPFQAPKLEKYTDMQNLILLDPVHEVGEQGWPHTAAGAEAQHS